MCLAATGFLLPLFLVVLLTPDRIDYASHVFIVREHLCVEQQGCIHLVLLRKLVPLLECSLPLLSCLHRLVIPLDLEDELLSLRHPEPIGLAHSLLIKLWQSIDQSVSVVDHECSHTSRRFLVAVALLEDFIVLVDCTEKEYEPFDISCSLAKTDDESTERLDHLLFDCACLDTGPD